MRLFEQLRQRELLRDSIEPLPATPLVIDFDKHFRIAPPDGLKRSLSFAVSRWVLAAMQPWIRKRLGNVDQPPLSVGR